jgi:hypothetical protein
MKTFTNGTHSLATSSQAGLAFPFDTELNQQPANDDDVVLVDV